MTHKRTVSGVAYFVLILLVAVTVFPILWSVIISFKQPIDVFNMSLSSFFRPTLESYKQILFPGPGSLMVYVGGYMKNSIIVAGISTLASVSIAVLAAYSMSRFEFWGKETFGVFIIGTRMLPPVGTIIPMYLLMSRLRLMDTHLALILIYTALNTPLAIWMLKSFIDDIPAELEEAAMIAGCSHFSALYWVTLPLIRPGIFAASVFAFLLSWSDFTLALVMTTQRAITLPLVGMQFRGEEGILWGPIMAASTVALLPPVIFITLVQKSLIKGLTLGAVKG